MQLRLWKLRLLPLLILLALFPNEGKGEDVWVEDNSRYTPVSWRTLAFENPSRGLQDILKTCVMCTLDSDHCEDAKGARGSAAGWMRRCMDRGCPREMEAAGHPTWGRSLANRRFQNMTEEERVLVDCLDAEGCVATLGCCREAWVRIVADSNNQRVAWKSWRVAPRDGDPCIPKGRAWTLDVAAARDAYRSIHQSQCPGICILMCIHVCITLFSGASGQASVRVLSFTTQQYVNHITPHALEYASCAHAGFLHAVDVEAKVLGAERYLRGTTMVPAGNGAGIVMPLLHAMELPRRGGVVLYIFGRLMPIVD